MSENLTKVVIDCTTGAQTVVPLTAAELAQRDQDMAAAAEAEQTREAELARVAALKESAKTKLIAGEPLTEDEAAILL